MDEEVWYVTACFDGACGRWWVTVCSFSSGSDIIYLKALGKDMVILNSYDVAAELLDKRSHIYSCR
jgi:hypothetical protein